MDTLKEKITRESESTNARFKRKKIRSMKREADKIAEKLRESKKELRAVEPRVPKGLISGAPLKLHHPNRNKCIEAKIAGLNKKIRKARRNKIRSTLITKRYKLTEELDFESNWGPVQLQRAFDNTYRSYRIVGYQGINPNTFFARIRKMLAG